MKLLFLLMGLTLAACADPHAPLAVDFGDAVSSNIAVQVVNPNPIPPSLSNVDGQRMDNAFNRYRTNKTYPPHLPLEGGKIFDTTQQQPQ